MSRGWGNRCLVTVQEGTLSLVWSSPFIQRDPNDRLEMFNNYYHQQGVNCPLVVKVVLGLVEGEELMIVLQVLYVRPLKIVLLTCLVL